MSKDRLTPFFRPIDRDRKRVYVSGPMTGLPQDNKPAFADAAEELREMGYAVCNPHETSEWLGHDLGHSTYLRFDFERVLEADFIVALDGWERSLGSIAEILMATRMGTKVWRWSTFRDYDLVTYEDVEAAISALHLGETKPTTLLSPDIVDGMMTAEFLAGKGVQVVQYPDGTQALEDRGEEYPYESL